MGDDKEKPAVETTQDPVAADGHSTSEAEHLDDKLNPPRKPEVEHDDAA